MPPSLPKKFLSRRDKSGGHRRGKSSEAKHRPLSSEAFFSLFKPAKVTEEDGESEQEKEENEAAKVAEVMRILADLEITNVTKDHILYALHAKSAAGDIEKAVDLMVLQNKSLSGKIIHYKPNVAMVGAENRGNVTCYLDALLFAMFAKLEAFECMLKTNLPDEPQRKLAALLRLWVNMLRSGKLIQADMTQKIQDQLADCGWKEAQLLEQQDTSEAFAFITETLQLPLLPLQVDLFHHGKNDEADHKVVYERLLNLAVPADADGKDVRLEDCLEDYFNSQIDVHRDSLDDKGGRRLTLTPTPRTPNEPVTPSTPRATMRVVTDDDNKSCLSPEVEHADSELLERHWSEQPTSQPSGSQEPQSPIRPNRSRTESIIQRVVIQEDGKPSDSDSASLFERAKRKASVVKAVTIPAWQFFRLIPWHSPANEEPQNDLEVAQHFSQRPVVGICLKRYMMTEQGVPRRQNTFVDIPDSLRLPQFIVDERHVEENSLSTEYKLVLQSVVCHRGDSLHSGHYISFCRVAPKLLTDNRRHDNDPPPDYEEAQWVKFDDLAFESRITSVDDIKQSLKDEMPYLLFYQILPIVDLTASSTDGTDAEPPSYNDTTVNVTVSESSNLAQEKPPISRQASSYFDNLSVMPSTNNSIRFSSELDRPSRRSFADEDGFLSVSRRGSVVYDNSTCASPSVTPIEGQSPAVTPSDETTAQKLFRAAHKVKGSGKSRPQSQAGEGRIGLTMSRLSGLMKGGSREPLRDSTFTDPEEEDFELVNASGATGQAKEKEKDGEKEKDREKEKEKDKEGSHQKRGRSKVRAEKGKAKGSKKAGDVPDRECLLM